MLDRPAKVVVSFSCAAVEAPCLVGEKLVDFFKEVALPTVEDTLVKVVDGDGLGASVVCTAFALELELSLPVVDPALARELCRGVVDGELCVDVVVLDFLVGRVRSFFVEIVVVGTGLVETFVVDLFETSRPVVVLFLLIELVEGAAVDVDFLMVLDRLLLWLFVTVVVAEVASASAVVELVDDFLLAVPSLVLDASALASVVVSSSIPD